MAKVEITSAPVVVAPQLVREILATESPLPAVPLHDWPKAYPDAARDLDRWTTEYPETARKLAVWAETHPEQLYSLLMWSVTSPYEDVNALFLRRWGWDDLEALNRDEPSAMADFVDWARRGQYAAVSFASYPDGFAWLRAHGAPQRSTLAQ